MLPEVTFAGFLKCSAEPWSTPNVPPKFPKIFRSDSVSTRKRLVGINAETKYSLKSIIGKSFRNPSFKTGKCKRFYWQSLASLEKKKKNRYDRHTTWSAAKSSPPSFSEIGMRYWYRHTIVGATLSAPKVHDNKSLNLFKCIGMLQDHVWCGLFYVLNYAELFIQNKCFCKIILFLKNTLLETL